MHAHELEEVESWRLRAQGNTMRPMMDSCGGASGSDCMEAIAFRLGSLRRLNILLSVVVGSVHISPFEESKSTRTHSTHKAARAPVSPINLVV